MKFSLVPPHLCPGWTKPANTHPAEIESLITTLLQPPVPNKAQLETHDSYSIANPADFFLKVLDLTSMVYILSIMMSCDLSITTPN